MVKIQELLSVGRENRVSADDLKRATGLSTRGLMEQIRRERRAGALILSDTSPGGFWLASPDDLEGLEEYYNRTRKTALNALATLRPIRQQLKRKYNTWQRNE